MCECMFDQTRTFSELLQHCPLFKWSRHAMFAQTSNKNKVNSSQFISSTFSTHYMKKSRNLFFPRSPSQAINFSRLLACRKTFLSYSTIYHQHFSFSAELFIRTHNAEKAMQPLCNNTKSTWCKHQANERWKMIVLEWKEWPELAPINVTRRTQSFVAEKVFRQYSMSWSSSVSCARQSKEALDSSVLSPLSLTPYWSCWRRHSLA